MDSEKPLAQPKFKRVTQENPADAEDRQYAEYRQYHGEMEKIYRAYMNNEITAAQYETRIGELAMNHKQFTEALEKDFHGDNIKLIRQAFKDGKINVNEFASQMNKVLTREFEGKEKRKNNKP